MRGPQQDHGDTLPGGLGPPIRREKPWTDLDEKCKRRLIQESQQGGGWGIVKGKDGKLETTRNPAPDERLK